MTARVILLAGPSGGGKSTIASRSRLPLLERDPFYRDGDDRGLARDEQLRMGDWDEIRSWDLDAAIVAVADICCDGLATVPVYDWASVGAHRGMPCT